MTQNQIAYWRLKEDQRANRANEGIRSREATAKEIEAKAKKDRLYAQTELDVASAIMGQGAAPNMVRTAFTLLQ